MEKKTKIIAVCGKGGVGKTSISAMTTRILASDKSRKVLAIDADPAVGLAIALGVNVTRTVDDVRNDLIAKIEKGEAGDKKEVLASLDYELLDSLVEKGNFAFLAIGRPEKSGCYCQVNTFLKQIIKEIAYNFDYVVIDGEAGIEQVNRRVMEMMTHLLLVSDASAKGRNVVETIAKVSKESVEYNDAGILLNMIRNKEDVNYIKDNTHLPVIGWIKDDETIYRYDKEGKSFFDLPQCQALDSVQSMVNQFILNSK